MPSEPMSGVEVEAREMLADAFFKEGWVKDANTIRSGVFHSSEVAISLFVIRKALSANALPQAQAPGEDVERVERDRRIADNLNRLAARPAGLDHDGIALRLIRSDDLETLWSSPATLPLPTLAGGR